MLINERTYYLTFLKSIHKKDLGQFLSSSQSSIGKVISSTKIKRGMLNNNVCREINDYFGNSKKYKSEKTKILVSLLHHFENGEIDKLSNLIIKHTDELYRNVFFNYVYHLTTIELIQYRKLKRAQSLIDLFEKKELKKGLVIYHSIAKILIAVNQSNLSLAKQHLKSIDKSDWKDHHTFMSMIYFLYKEDYKKSWLHAQAIKETDCPINLQLAKLICAYELNELDYVVQCISSLSKLNSKAPYIAIILQFFEKLHKNKKDLSVREINKLRIKIDEYHFDSPNPMRHLTFTPFYEWINSKTKGK